MYCKRIITRTSIIVKFVTSFKKHDIANSELFTSPAESADRFAEQIDTVTSSILRLFNANKRNKISTDSDPPSACDS